MLFKELYFVGSALGASAINAASLLSVIYLLSPKQLGEWSLILLLSNLVSATFFFSTKISIVRFNISRSLFIKCRSINILFASALFAIVMFFLLSFCYLGSMSRIITLALFLGMSQALFEITCEFFRVERNGRLYFFATVLRSSSLVIFLYIFSSVLSATATLCTAAWLLSYSLGTLPIGFCWPSGRVYSSLDEIKLKRILLYGIPSSLTFILSILSSNVERLVLAHFLDLEDVGLYFSISGIISMIYTSLFNSVNIILFPKMLSLYPCHKIYFELTFRRAVELFLLVGIPLTFSIFLFGPNAFGVFSAAFTEYNNWFILLASVASFATVYRSYITDVAYHITENTTAHLLRQFTMSVIAVCTSILLVPYLGIAGAFLSSVVTSLLNLSIGARYCRRIFAWRSKDFFLIILPIMWVIGLIMLDLFWSNYHFFLSIAVALIVICMALSFWRLLHIARVLLGFGVRS